MTIHIYLFRWHLFSKCLNRYNNNNTALFDHFWFWSHSPLFANVDYKHHLAGLDIHGNRNRCTFWTVSPIPVSVSFIQLVSTSMSVLNFWPAFSTLETWRTIITKLMQIHKQLLNESLVGRCIYITIGKCNRKDKEIAVGGNITIKLSFH